MRRRFMNGDKGVYEPSQAPYGIYIVHIDGLAYERSAWFDANLDNKDVVGLGVKTEKCSFIMSLFEKTSIE